jgi:hypothetical protein
MYSQATSSGWDKHAPRVGSQNSSSSQSAKSAHGPPGIVHASLMHTSPVAQQVARPGPQRTADSQAGKQTSSTHSSVALSQQRPLPHAVPWQPTNPVLLLETLLVLAWLEALLPPPEAPVPSSSGTSLPGLQAKEPVIKAATGMKSRRE